MSIDEDIALAVQSHYGNPLNWSPQSKDLTWADYILIESGHMLQNKDILNLGCFYPEDEMRLAHWTHTWTAIDFTREVIAECKKIRMDPNVRFLHADMTNMSEETFKLQRGEEDWMHEGWPASFDMILDFSSGDHLPREAFERMLGCVHSLLRPSGFFVEVFTNSLRMRDHRLWTQNQTCDTRFGYERGDTPEEMRYMLAGAGFMVVRTANDQLPRTGYLCAKTG